MGDIADRKAQHIKLALEEGSQGSTRLSARQVEPFNNFQLPIRALPEIDLADVNTSTKLLGKKINQPLIIASMTGGAADALQININLATAAEKMKVGLAVGSQRVALEKREARKSFEIVRRKAPTAVIFANMGAVQLNYGRTIEDYKEIVKMAGADGLYLHLNPIQEAIQPEGDTNFKFLMPKIQKLIEKIGVPVWVKEVGCGLDEATAKKLIDAGVAGIDVAGVGGTSWTWIEGKRSGNKNLTEWFADWGIPTEEGVRSLSQSLRGMKAKLVASGGIRNPIQGLKAHLLGADYYSAARPFLGPAMESAEAVQKLIADWERGLKIAMFGCGKISW